MALEINTGKFLLAINDLMQAAVVLREFTKPYEQWQPPSQLADRDTLDGMQQMLDVLIGDMEALLIDATRQVPLTFSHVFAKEEHGTVRDGESVRAS